MFFKRHDLTLMMRVKELDETIRSPIDAGEAKKLLKHIKAWKIKISNSPKTRASSHQKKMDTGDPYLYAEVYKGLSKQLADGKLSAADRMHLNQCSEFLSEELANALGKTESEVLAQMEEASNIQVA